MRLLLIHQNLPGQYRHLLVHYGRQPDCQVVGLGEMKRLKENIRKPIPGVRLVGYDTPPTPTATTLATLRTTEAAVQRGQKVLVALLKLKQAGFTPDVVYAHPGWGETLFLKDVFPRARLIHFCEFYYHATDQDFNFDPEFPCNAEDVLRLRINNLHHLMALEQADIGIAPTVWQQTRFPTIYQPKIAVIHDGVDTTAVAPDPEAFLRFPKHDLTLTRKDEVITFVSRNLEPYRGFHTFMRALPELLKARPKAHIVIVGGNGVSYGRRLAKGSYREKYLAELNGRIDLQRVHFVGKLPYDTFLRVLQVSTAHVYLTYPFVLSWSMMEAMAAGCLVIGSRTAPVQEVIRDGENGLLVDFFSTSELVDAIRRVCNDPTRMQELREAARRTIVEGYDLHGVCLPRQKALIESSTDQAVLRIDSSERIAYTA
ncbi:glycosyltransferase family 4 protein [Paraburkholderia aspalathi]|uniref:Glycosyltransferase involved in cell wall bisynthesis n=1 Tax=Paraburkholderia aspalathi TaxID=1324617 RepID=A0A1I7ACD3_9BURK|nr:glycosyltransferase family 4 protein [Paraburkholderia aspalathi]SFT72554.1 Glycosyltransferase involved in cell wall bisynthesis [Paraburkholderia aspalathi]